MSKRLLFKGLAIGALGMLLSSCVGADVEEDESFQEGAEELAVDSRDPAAGDVGVSLTADRTTLGGSDSVTVKVTLTNNARHEVRLLSWYTAAEELEEELFEVTRDGQPVEYIGPHYKRPAPRQSDFITLASGESLTRTVDLTDFYDLSKTGSYHVRYAVELKHQGKKQAVALASNEVGLWIEGRQSGLQKVAAGGTSNVTSSLSFTKCTASQQSTVTSALGAASGMADGSVSYLNGSASGTPRYGTWFGAFSSNGWNTAKSHFGAIKDAIDTKSLAFNCGCKKQYYAYVYPAQPYSIYLCSAFWSAPLTGTDSKGGTLVHELSHFTVIAGTDDYVYGQSGAKSLATSNPSQALFNADNHEYFAENTPNLQ